MKIILFGIVKEIIGKSEIDFTLNDCSTIDCLQEKLKVNYPKLVDIKKFAFAINEEYADLKSVISENDVVAIIPPVSGG